MPSQPDSTLTNTSSTRPVPWLRCAISGVLMGLANLVPGVSGGTMILIMGLYDEFISAVADVTRFKFTMRSISILAVIGGVALLTIALMAGVLAELVLFHPVIMYALFIGMTLGGAPMLWRMITPLKAQSAVAFAVGIAVMVVIAASSSDTARPSDEEKARIREQVKNGEFPLTANYGRDLAAGVLGMSAMVLPGVSGAYMLLLLGRYEQVLAAVSVAKDVATGNGGDMTAVSILIPVAIGILISVVAVTNILKWLLRQHEKPTVALLLGVLIGSVIMLFQMIEIEARADYVKAAILLPVGFAATILLGRLGGSQGTAKQGPSTA